MRKRRDANHAEVVGFFRLLGCSVHDTSQVGDSFPDLVVCKLYRAALVEIKDDSGKLSDGQQEFIANCRGPYFVVRTFEDCQTVEKFLRLDRNPNTVAYIKGKMQ